LSAQKRGEPKLGHRKKQKMKISPKNGLGLILMVVGLLVIAFSKEIVFPGFERIVGIETIVGKENVVYQPDGSYVFTNSAAMAIWVVSVMVIGLIILIVGIWLSGMRIKFPQKGDKTSN
jgi:hypothetical protein